MTDKEQRIVDGVDVSSCAACNLNCGIPQCSEFFKHFPSSIYCRDNANCLFKQLARKTHECEQKDERILELMRAYTELKEKFEALKLENQEGYEIVAELKHECEELKNTLKKLTRGVVLPAIPEPEVIDLTNRYRKALEEIEEVAKEMHSICIEEISITASQLNDRIYRESCERFKQILDIINKAKGEEQ